MKSKVVANCLIAYWAYRMLKRNKKNSKRKPICRVNPYLMERNSKGRFATDFEDMVENPRIFYENFHMDIDAFNELYALLEPHLLPGRNIRPDAIDPKQKLAIVLEFLASGSLPRHMASVYRISKQHLGTIIDSVCRAICLQLKPFLSALTEKDFIEIANGFDQRWQFPNCLGAIDGKHIALKAPSKSGSMFYNYKGFHSIVLFAVADWRYKFIYLDIGAYGSEGDANIFANSDFGKAVLNDKMNFPQNAQVNGESLPFYFIGDDAFPLCARIMKPFGGKSKLSDEAVIFNYRLSRARRCVENAFGILCAKWLCLKRTMFCSPDRAQKIVTACCLLHNFLLEKSKTYCSLNFIETIDSEGNLIEGEFRLQNNPSSLSGSSLGTFRGRQCDVGKLIREKLKKFVNSPEGEVKWQRQATYLPH